MTGIFDSFGEAIIGAMMVSVGGIATYIFTKFQEEIKSQIDKTFNWFKQSPDKGCIDFFIGDRPYTKEEKKYFLGRDKEKKEIKAPLKNLLNPQSHTKILLINGKKSSGKSSFINVCIEPNIKPPFRKIIKYDNFALISPQILAKSYKVVIYDQFEKFINIKDDQMKNDFKRELKQELINGEVSFIFSSNKECLNFFKTFCDRDCEIRNFEIDYLEKDTCKEMFNTTLKQYLGKKKLSSCINNFIDKVANDLSENGTSKIIPAEIQLAYGHISKLQENQINEIDSYYSKKALILNRFEDKIRIKFDNRIIKENLLDQLNNKSNLNILQANDIIESFNNFQSKLNRLTTVEQDRVIKDIQSFLEHKCKIVTGFPGFLNFLDDMIEYFRYNTDKRVLYLAFSKDERTTPPVKQRLETIREMGVKMYHIVSEDCNKFQGNLDEYKKLPDMNKLPYGITENSCTFIYGDTIAVQIEDYQQEIQLLVMDNSIVAKGIKTIYYLLWNNIVLNKPINNIEDQGNYYKDCK